MKSSKIIPYLVSILFFLTIYYFSQFLLFNKMTEPYLGYLIRACIAGSPVPMEVCETLPGYQSATASAGYIFSATLAFFVSLAVYRVSRIVFGKNKDID